MKRLCLFVFRYLLSVAANVWVSLLGLMPRYREACYEAAYRLGWRNRPIVLDEQPSLDIQAIEMRHLIPDPPSIKMLEADAANGNVTEWELLSIVMIVASCKPEACFEIGTFDGRTALNMAANLAPGGHVYTLDLPPADADRTALSIAHGDEHFIRKTESGARFKGTPYANHITQLWGDSATFDYAPYEGKMDVVFVDGAHSYAYVKKDTETALRLLKPTGGFILWHDYGSMYWKDLTRAMNEIYRDEPRLRGMVRVQGSVLVVCRVGVAT
jgi:predicted O-methyltransferase YrrM